MSWCCASEASAPTCTPSTAASPITSDATRPRNACTTASKCARGTMASDRDALLAGLQRHLAHDLGDGQVELGAAGRDLRPEDRRIQRVRLGIERDRVVRQVWMGAQPGRRLCRAGEGHDVLRVEPLEQAAHAAHDELQRPWRQQPGRIEASHQRLGQVGGRDHLELADGLQVVPVVEGPSRTGTSSLFPLGLQRGGFGHYPALQPHLDLQPQASWRDHARQAACPRDGRHETERALAQFGLVTSRKRVMRWLDV